MFLTLLVNAHGGADAAVPVMVVTAAPNADTGSYPQMLAISPYPPYIQSFEQIKIK